MTEKQKMMAGEIYNCNDTELQTRWHKAKELQRELYLLDFNNPRREQVLDELLGSRGENSSISAPLYVDYGENIHLGKNVEINMNCTFLDCNRITIGDYSGIGPNVQIYAVSHPIVASERLNDNGTLWKCFSAPVTIGSNVWIGGGAIILAGVTIGDNTTIGAGSVVTKSIPANCLAVGNPCRVVKML